MIADMLKVQLAVPSSKGEELMTWLQEQEVLHITEAKMASEEAPSQSTVDRDLAYIQFALEFVNRIRGELNVRPKKSWRDAFASKPVASLARLEQTIEGLSVDKLDRRIRKISDELAHLKAREQEIADLMAVFHPWRKLLVTGAQLRGLENIHYMLIKVGVQEDLSVKRAMMGIKTAVWQEANRIVTKKRGKVYLEVVVHRTEAKKMEKIIAATSAEVVNLPVPADQTVEKYVKSIQTEAEEVKKRYRSLLEKGKRFLKVERELRFAYDGLLHRRERETVRRKSLHLPRVMVLAGWLPRHIYKTFSDLLEEEFPYAAIAVEKKPKEVPPVALKNAKRMEPFEAVTNIYGRP
jgi:vacuolar-type H+-ATPase subunit I/STV1